MKAELRNSGMSEEEILLKTCLLMKCFNREDPGASMAEYNLASKQKNLALKNNGTSPKDFTLVSNHSYLFDAKKLVKIMNRDCAICDLTRFFTIR